MVASGLGGKGLRPATIRTARRIATGEPISLAQAIKMRAWLHRFGPNTASAHARRTDPTSPAAVAWMLWGGDPAIDWKADPAVKWVEGIVAGEHKRSRRNGTSMPQHKVTPQPYRERPYTTGDLERAGEALARREFSKHMIGRRFPAELLGVDYKPHIKKMKADGDTFAEREFGDGFIRGWMSERAAWLRELSTPTARSRR